MKDSFSSLNNAGNIFVDLLLAIMIWGVLFSAFFFSFNIAPQNENTNSYSRDNFDYSAFDEPTKPLSVIYLDDEEETKEPVKETQSPKELAGEQLLDAAVLKGKPIPSKGSKKEQKNYFKY